ncbi:MAG: biotin--[acetyl-CoA-carboxylase] ligase [Deltaproteobacteria bacterium]|nr:biotin--[acetyl-CoA-carboxylase] ligase [Deltaproteobacteria bacterium]
MRTRDSILSILKAHGGTWVSGEYLSSELSVSRSAVWKHVSILKRKGYSIESAPKKGYRLRKVSHKPLPEEISEGLDTRVFGKRDIIHLEECDSTNRIARDLARKGVPEGAIVLAEKQTRGRGRMGREWFSPPEGGIYLTMVLRPVLSPSKAPKLTLITGVALAECLRETAGVDARIKWPNDVVLGGRKLAGILTELSAEIDAVNYVLVGAGVNVNTESFPLDLQEKATSLFIETGETFSRASLVKNFLGRFEDYYFESQGKGFEEVIKRWNEMTETLGRKVKVESGSKTYAGEALAVDADGALLLRDDGGELHRIVSGDVELI